MFESGSYGLGDLSSGVTPQPGDTRFNLNLDGIVDVHDLDQWRAERSYDKRLRHAVSEGRRGLNGVVDSGNLNSLALNWRQNAAA